MASDWSSQIAQRFGCRLSAELIDWFDRDIWARHGLAEFCQPIEPARLIDEAPDAIRPGMMRCDLLPIISNNRGDWLCVRIDETSLAAEIIHWYHGGGDWIPWGRSLAEAIVFDAVADRFPSYRRRHAEPAERLRPATGSLARAQDPLLAWALANLPPAIGPLVQSPAAVAELAAGLLEHRVAEVAVRCEQVICIVLDPDPDWESAANIASDAARAAPELAWPWEIIGLAAERRNDLTGARQAYQQAARCSAFTDQSVRLMTHAATQQATKFSVVRLLQLAPELVQGDPYLRLLSGGDHHACRQAVSQYWMDQAQQGRQSAAAAYDCWVSAGWDVGAVSLAAYGAILRQAAAAAAAANQPGRAAVAVTHSRCLREKFGV